MLAVMLTCTTYGTWLRGDARGWVEDGIVYPSNPFVEDVDRRRLKHDEFTFPRGRLLEIGEMIGRSLIDRLEQVVLALTVQTWHVHAVIRSSKTPVPAVAACLKDAVRYGLRAGRPIWTTNYDKRYCFEEFDAVARIAYVERHNLRDGLPARPWPWIAAWR